jgi:hypothetical protein
MEAFTTACILIREDTPDKHFIKEIISSLSKKVSPTEKYNYCDEFPEGESYSILDLGISEFIDKHGVDVGFEVFYC